MSDERKLGDIDLEDYLWIVRKKRPFRLVRALAIAGACVFAFAAGVLSPWPGKGTRDLTLRDALAILDRTPSAEWEHELGVTATHNHLIRALDAMGRVAQEPNRSGNYATLSLRHLTRRALQTIVQQSEDGPHAGEHRQTLELIREDLPPR